MRKFSVRKRLLLIKSYDYYLALQTVQANSGTQLKDSFHEKVVIVCFWTFSDIHSSHMMQKIIGIDKHYSASGVSYLE